jgi:hypothetical protein
MFDLVAAPDVECRNHFAVKEMHSVATKKNFGYRPHPRLLGGLAELGGDGRWEGSRGASFQRTGLATEAVCHCGARSGVSSPQSRAPGLLGGMAPNDVLWRCRFGRRTRPQAGIDSGWEMLRPFSWRLVCVEASQQAVEKVGEAG